MKCPTIDERFADNGEHSHWVLVDASTGETLWDESNRADELRDRVMAEVAFGIIAHKVKADVRVVRTVTDNILVVVRGTPTATTEGLHTPESCKYCNVPDCRYDSSVTHSTLARGGAMCMATLWAHHTTIPTNPRQERVTHES